MRKLRELASELVAEWFTLASPDDDRVSAREIISHGIRFPWWKLRKVIIRRPRRVVFLVDGHGMIIDCLL